ncbi:MAG: fused MFS/spermidine synthase [Planctomycetes bacterium]|nr:fused MFS/spermidine synthase [Planctomycetota bacterium]
MNNLQKNGAPTAPTRWLLVHLIACGASTVAVEVCAFRLLAPSFGSTQFITTNVLGVVLASLAAGYWIGGRTADRRPSEKLLYSISLVAAVLLIILPFVADPVLAAARPAISNQNASLFVGTLAAMLLIFGAPMFLLGMVSPFTIRLLARGDASAGSRGGLVFALSTVGSIAGAYLPALLTIPLMGTRGSIQLFGALVLASAAAGLFFARARAASGGAAMIMIAPIVMMLFPQRRALAPNVIEERETAYHVVRVVRDDREKRNLLEMNEGLSYHSIQYDDRRISPGEWGYFLLLPDIARPRNGAEKPKLDICIVGLAAGTIATQLQMSFGDEYGLHIDGVEIDGEIVELGRRFFGLDERFLSIFIEDGRTFLARTDRKYDIIIGDAYRQPYIPAHLVTREYFEIVKSHLKPGGVCAVNAGAPNANSIALRGIQNALVAAFGSSSRTGGVGRFEVINTDVPFNNYIFFASDGPIRPRLEASHRADLALHKRAALYTWTALSADPSAPTFTDDRSPVEWYTDLSILQIAMR